MEKKVIKTVRDALVTQVKDARTHYVYIRRDKLYAYLLVICDDLFGWLPLRNLERVPDFRLGTETDIVKLLDTFLNNSWDIFQYDTLWEALEATQKWMGALDKRK